MRSLFLALLLALQPAADAADPNKPHPHQGVLKPYPRPPTALRLSAEQEAQVLAGQPVFTVTEGAEGGRGAAAFVVAAPPTRVWQVIKSFHRYPQWISGVSACEVYKTAGDHLYARFVLSKMGVEVEYFIDHTFGPGWATWTLDYSRESDLDDSVGMWRVTPLPNDPARSRVEYSIDIRVGGWVPGFIRDLVVDQGLRDATQWVKAQSEKAG